MVVVWVFGLSILIMVRVMGFVLFWEGLLMMIFDLILVLLLVVDWLMVILFSLVGVWFLIKWGWVGIR